MLRETVIPALQRRPNFEETLFMQDGAPCHYGRAVREYLDRELPQRWMRRAGPIPWPPRSPDLTPMDFFVWGAVKDRVFRRKPANMEELRGYIREELDVISNDRDLCQRACRSVERRLEACVSADGGQFQHSKF